MDRLNGDVCSSPRCQRRLGHADDRCLMQPRTLLNQGNGKVSPDSAAVPMEKSPSVFWPRMKIGDFAGWTPAPVLMAEVSSG